jgi:hypothetical protein
MYYQIQMADQKCNIQYTILCYGRQALSLMLRDEFM